MSRRLRVLLAGAVMTSLMLVMASTAWATTFTVTNTSDFGKGSLREAMEAANSNPGANEIEFAEGVSGTITLASTLPTVTDPEGLTIDGGGDVTVSGNNRVRVLQEANGAKLALKNLTIAGGYSGDLTDGGGIYNGGGTLTVTNSTFSGNTASQFGGSVYNRGELEVTDSTFSGNSASTGGAIYNRGRAILRNTIVANNAGLVGNCVGVGTLSDGGFNVEDANTCSFSRATGSLPATDPLFDPDGLQDNGGPTNTIALRAGSPAVDLVGESACPPPHTDQRGVERPQGEACDAGAFELVQAPAPYTFSGFFRPVDNLPTMNVVKAGSAVPVKFSLGGDEGLDIFADGYPKSRQIDCASTAPPRCVLHGLTVQRGPSEPSAKGTSDGPAPAYPPSLAHLEEAL